MSPVGDPIARPVLLIVAAWVFFVLPGLGARDHWTAAEARPPLVARDILATGRVAPPYLAGEPYLNKPPLYHAMVAASFVVFGESEAAARLPAALAALLAMLLVFHWVADREGVGAGVAAALFLLASGRFFTLARSAELETLLTAAAAATYLGASRALDGRGPAWRGWGLAAFGAAVATWTKGPALALVFPVLWLVVAAVARREVVRPLLGAAVIALGVLVATAAYYGPLWLDPTWRQALENRVTFANVAHVRSPLYYLEKLPLGLLPALVLALPAGSLGLRASRDALVALGVGVVAFSCSASKQSHYLLPLYPFAAWWGGVAIERVMRTGRRRGLIVAATLGTLIAPATAVALAVGTEGVAPVTGAILAILAATGLVALVALVRGARGLPGRVRSRELLLLALCALAHLLAADAVGGARLDSRRSCAAAMTVFRERIGDAPCVSADDSPTLLYYLGRDRLPHVPTAAGLRAFLERNPDGFAIVETEADEVQPVDLASAREAARWTSPDGRGWRLLGPGL